MATIESSGIAKAGLTTGVVGLSLAGLSILNSLRNNNGWLGGMNSTMLNGMNQVIGDTAAAKIAEQQAEIEALKSQKYTDEKSSSNL